MIQLPDYDDFTDTKFVAHVPSGFNVSLDALSPHLFRWQKIVTQWALMTGQVALFEECGLGKTTQGLEIATHVANHTNLPVIWLSPLSVAFQTQAEANKFGYVARYVRSEEEARRVDSPIIIANYEMLKHFNTSHFGGVILDESSILKNYVGMMKRQIMARFHGTAFKYAMSATPSPNDHLELGNHSAFLDVMPSDEMIARFFINDSMNAGGYRLRHHGRSAFWEWVATWAVCLSKPSDIGYDDDGYILPPPELIEVPVNVDHSRAHAQGQLFLDGSLSSTKMWSDKSATLQDRIARAVEVVKAEPNECWVVWVDTNEEADLMQAALPEAVEVRGNHHPTIKEKRLQAFSDGTVRILITKKEIASFGLNWQHCARMVFVGLTYSFEQFYQALRRSYRYGNPRTVKAFLIIAETEQGIRQSLMGKWAAHEEMQREMVAAMKITGLGETARKTLGATETDIDIGDHYTIHLGDAIPTLAGMEEGSIDHTVNSPPFRELYIYSDKKADLGNAGSHSEFYQHYRYYARELSRVLKVGGRACIHCKDLPLYANRDGAMGLSDFPGDLIGLHEEEGLTLVNWITVWKDPVIEMQRTKNAGLLWSEAFCKRAERARQGMADYVLVFEKGGKPITNTPAPVPASVVTRCVDLWANPSDFVYAPGYNDAKGFEATPQNPSRRWALVFWDIEKVGEDVSPVVERLMDGRIFIHRVGTPADMTKLIIRCKEFNLVFHSRVALTDGTWLVVFRKWVDPMPETHVTHKLKASKHKFIGKDGPKYWKNDRDYSIQVWQRYASPVWFDLEGLPTTHSDIWMNIKQTNVLNGTVAREDADEKHICPLQLDLIELCLMRYSEPGQVILSPFAGIGSEGVVSLKLSRRFVGVELKRAYWEQARKHLREAEFMARQPMLL